jgi:alkylation response protein AidB-like acyl-CoA dehydrogenase
VSTFYQDGPTLGNPYADDPLLRRLLERRLPRDVFTEVDPGLRALGRRAATEIAIAGDGAEAAPPRFIPYDPWGRRTDRIETAPAWQTLERIAAEEGIVATAYERAHGPWSRVHQCARFFLYAPPSATFSCPLAMTDGAARCLELYGNELRESVYPHLVTRDPAAFWTSGQWMTERTGGSDVGETTTIARVENGRFHLHGTKWFTSASTSPIALTLARIEGAPPGTRGLSLFLVRVRDDAGALQHIRIHRLKDKLGTRALPTAELSLEGTPATPIGTAGQGVRTIAAMFNITRILNACAAAAGMRQALMLALDYARKRQAFGHRLIDLSLHRETLADLEVECEAACHLVMYVAELLGREECGAATPDEAALLRLLTPVVKLYTAKQAIAVASEVIEAFGGAGYIEDTGIPRLLRDAQVLAIWEGTTNVLSLDARRAIEHDAALGPALTVLRARLRPLASGALPTLAAVAAAALDRIERHAMSGDADTRDVGARRLAFAIARTTAALLLIEYASPAPGRAPDRRAMVAAQRWCASELTPFARDAAERAADSRILVEPPLGEAL